MSTARTYGELMRQLGPLVVLHDRLEMQLLHAGAIIVLPSGMQPDVTAFLGMRVIHAEDVSQPMIAIPGTPELLADVLGELEAVNGPATPQEIAGVRDELGIGGLTALSDYRTKTETKESDR